MLLFYTMFMFPNIGKENLFFWLTFKILCRFCTIVSMIECVWGEVLWMWNIFNLLINRYKGSLEPFFIWSTVCLCLCLYVPMVYSVFSLHSILCLFSVYSSWCVNGVVKEIHWYIYKSGVYTFICRQWDYNLQWTIFTKKKSFCIFFIRYLCGSKKKLNYFSIHQKFSTFNNEAIWKASMTWIISWMTLWMDAISF